MPAKIAATVHTTSFTTTAVCELTCPVVMVSACNRTAAPQNFTIGVDPREPWSCSSRLPGKRPASGLLIPTTSAARLLARVASTHSVSIARPKGSLVQLTLHFEGSIVARARVAYARLPHPRARAAHAYVLILQQALRDHRLDRDCIPRRNRQSAGHCFQGHHQHVVVCII